MDVGLAQIRGAHRSDAGGIARVHIASSDDSYAPLALDWPAQDLAKRTDGWAASLAASLADSRRVDLVATVQDLVVGFVSGGPARRDSLPAQVEVYVVHVLPEHRGHGIGGRLWARACATLRGPSLDALYVETLAELRCCAFYEAHGGEVLARVAGLFHGGPVTEVVYVWPKGRPHAPANSEQRRP